MTSFDFENDYLNYYKTLENDFKNTIRYVSLSPDNLDTYLIEYAYMCIYCII